MKSSHEVLAGPQQLFLQWLWQAVIVYVASIEAAFASTSLYSLMSNF